MVLDEPNCVLVYPYSHFCFLYRIGYYHEQSRPDRDTYITINYANILAGMEARFKIESYAQYEGTLTKSSNNIVFLIGTQNNFQKYNSSTVYTFGTPYDYASVMHYEATAFSSNGQPTITPLQAGVTIGQRYNMSSIDIQEVRLFYNCSSTGVTLAPVTPAPGGNSSIRLLF